MYICQVPRQLLIIQSSHASFEFCGTFENSLFQGGAQINNWKGHVLTQVVSLIEFFPKDTFVKR